MSFSLSTYKKTVPAKIVAEGETTFNQGCVKKIDSNKNNEWIAQVTIGTEVFNVEIMIDDEKNILDHFCDCPSETEHCRHQVATFLKLKEVLPKFIKEKAKTKAKEKAPPKPKKLTPLEAVLAKTSFIELQEFVRKNAAANKVFKNTFMVHFADKNDNIDKKYYVDLLKSTLSAIKKSGYLGSRDTNTFLKTANEIALKSANSLDAGLFKDFAPIALAFIEVSLPLLRRMDSYELQNIIKAQYKGMQVIAKKCPIELKISIFKDLLDIISANINEFYEYFKDEFSAILDLCSKEKDLSDVFLAFLKSKTEINSGYLSWEFKTTRSSINLPTKLVELQKSYYEANRMLDKIPDLLSKNLHNNQFRKDYINHLLSKKDYVSAQKVLENIYKYSFDNTGHIESFWFETIADVYQKLNNISGLETLYLYRFRQSQYIDYATLSDLKKIISEKQWKDIFSVFENEIIKKQNHNFSYGRNVSKKPLKLGHLYVFDKRWQDLERMVVANGDLESIAPFANLLLTHCYDSFFAYLDKNLNFYFINLYHQQYESLADVIAALDVHKDKNNVLFEKTIYKITTFHLGKKQFINALKKRGVEIA